MKDVLPFAPRRGSPVPQGSGFFVAIDPGNHTGWSLWSPSHFKTNLLACGVGAPPYENASQVVLECPQVYPHSPVNPNDLVTLAFLAGRYAGHFGGDVKLMFPHFWKGSLPKNVCENRCRMRLSREELAVTAVAEAACPKSQHNDLWDAIGIGLVAFRNVKL